MATMREDSKRTWTGASTIETINAGSLQRIADAAEKMAENYTQLQKDLEYYKNGYRMRWEIIVKKNRTISALKGHITRLKKSK